MNKQLGTLITLRDNINVTVQTLLERKDLTGETLPTIDELMDWHIIEEAEDITRGLMLAVIPESDGEYYQPSSRVY